MENQAGTRGTKMVQVKVRLPQATLERLDAYAERTGNSRQSVMSLALAFGLESLDAALQRLAEKVYPVVDIPASFRGAKEFPTVEGDDPFSVAHNKAAEWLNRDKQVVAPHEFTEEEAAAVEAKIESNDSDLVEIQRGINEAYRDKMDPLRVHRHRFTHLQAGTEDRRSGVDWALYACECGDKQERRVK